MEIGWYLRLSRARELEVLVAANARPVLEDQAMIVSGWRLFVEEREGFVRGLYVRGG